MSVRGACADRNEGRGRDQKNASLKGLGAHKNEGGGGREDPRPPKKKKKESLSGAGADRNRGSFGAGECWFCGGTAVCVRWLV